ncbi:DUF6249 domain-containing protein [Maricaulis sp. CAU 1757]
MPTSVMLVSLAPFLMVVAIVWIAVFNAAKTRQKTLGVVEEAIRSGQPLTPETVRALGMPRKDSRGDLKAGAILIAVAVAFICLGFAISAVEGDPEPLYIMPAVAAFPGFIGLVLVAFGLTGKKDKDAV